jgi:glycosyltransferase involved in cell wall biosynthesis
MDKIVARNLLGIKFNGPIIGCVGDIDPARGIEELLTACRRLVERGRKLKILVTSLHYECKDDHVLRLMAKLMKDRVLIPLFRPISINLIMNAIDVFAMPMTVDYSTEPPMAFIEALSSGVPIVAGPSPSLLDYRGMYLMVSDKDSLVEELDKALEGEYKELAERNRDFGLKNMSFEAVANRLKDIFDGLR